MRKICVLGSTGSIGVSTLDVIKRNPERFSVVSLAANSNVEVMFEQCQRFKPEKVVMVSESHAKVLQARLSEHDLAIEVLSGEQALCDIASEDSIDTVMAAIVGAAGLLPTYAAIKADKRVLLANKEALVTSGQIFIDALQASKATLLPIDSEHNAIFQCLPWAEQEKVGACQLTAHGVNKILLTGSGGPFRTYPLTEFNDITPEQACKHPNWDMGKKISVDSATMMNKGLEFIEAKWLFNVEPEDIQVVLHPQSTIHSMVQYKDGSVLAQMGNPDMRTPIAHALAYPERVDAGVDNLDFFTTASFDFQAPDFERYPNLKLAIDACKSGQAACTALNAANEIAVEAFLNNEIKFTDIFKINETSVKKFVLEQVTSIEEVVHLDSRVRQFATTIVKDNAVNHV
ncbi:1-deoxy-D-xylulose-5-phosphate reductoisomerase [Thalassotalea sp. LPB0316]|uniref:1-deoxy-D-xylulose-5-phosphate reductoisomerase n=1 Tax=Thalassotalea sp. LPB0316 TaxID=2769490 RepID=UPI001867C8E5|nr:1-deoxy-D-xylulose-5-phosphate reductoisomerase [Thalassotalea sp. LPB0316]QOL24602.1 1-deoxy-D-xylulose-5-phosphate reductoisomerase [Thalassotalea sp. LPB0316]